MQFLSWDFDGFMRCPCSIIAAPGSFRRSGHADTVVWSRCIAKLMGASVMADFRDDNFIRLERFPLPQVKADCRQILLKLTQAAVQGGGALFGYPGSLSSAITSLFGAAEAIRIDTPPERLAWYLVHEALKQALTDLLFHLRLQG